MNEFIEQNLTHIVALIIFLARLSEILTTRLISPTLKLGTNVLARRLGWKFAIATLAISAVPYYSVPLGAIFATACLLGSASNATAIMRTRALGEQESVNLMQLVISRTSVSMGIVYMFLPAAFYALLGCMILFLYPNPMTDWGFYFAIGILSHAFTISFWSIINFLSLKKKSQMAVTSAIIA